MHSIKQIGFIFYAEASDQFVAIPEPKELVNSFDLVGDLVSLQRNKEEKNIDYKNRLLDVNVNPGSAIYSGVVNNILRDLGLTRNKAFKIELVLDGNDIPLAENPKVDILANRIVLYDDWVPGEEPSIDLEIRTYKPEDEGYYLLDLVAYINDNSSYFTATAYATRTDILSSNLIRLSSVADMSDELIQSDYRTKLIGTNIIASTVDFSEKKVFTNEVSTLIKDGDYKVDYVDGYVYNYSLSSGNSFVSYMYNIFPLEIEYCDLQLFTLNDEDFVSELFDKEHLPFQTYDYFDEPILSGIEVNGLLNLEGAEIYHDVYKNNKIFWGK